MSTAANRIPAAPFCLPAHIIPDDDSTSASVRPSIDRQEDEGDSTPIIDLDDHRTDENLPFTFSTPEQATPESLKDVDIVPDAFEDDDLRMDDPSYELLRQHYKMNHLSFAKLQLMAKNGEFPSRLATCKIPKCVACLYGKATKRPWRSRARNRNKLFVATKPGQVVSIDQMESSTPGLIAQMRGFLTKQRYRVATVFTDHYSCLSYVHMQKTTNMDDTLEAKRAFENFAQTHGVQVSHYHCNNGRFADRAFRDKV